MKRVVIVAPHFPPSNLTGVHRSRFLAAHLRKFGWDPVVLTVLPEYYEEKLDHDLEKMLPGDIKIIRTRALSTKPLRLVGDISIRCFFWHWAELRRLARAKAIDFVYISIFPAYTALLGRLIHDEFGIPYGIDYQDPWVEYRRADESFMSKRRISQFLAKILEPFAVRKASLISAVADSYITGVIERNPSLSSAEKLEIPIGIDPEDQRYAETAVFTSQPLLFSKDDSKFRVVYAGAVLPESIAVWTAFFDGLKLIRERDPRLFSKIEILCLGTGKQVDDSTSGVIIPMARRAGLDERCIVEHAARIPYVQVLRHLKASNLILVIGSVEKHYTASKIFQAVYAGSPILALLHRESTALKMLLPYERAQTVSFETAADLSSLSDEISKKFAFSLSNEFAKSAGAPPSFEAYTANAIASKLAQKLDRIVPT